MKPESVFWLTAVAAVVAVTWLVLSAAPHDQPSVEMTAAAEVNVLPYLAAHQDYAQALTSGAEMHFTWVALTAPEAAR